MQVPGSNLLNAALRVIHRQRLIYYRYISRSLNSVGQDISVFAEPVMILGSFQPVPKNLYYQYGLDLQKSYFALYTSNNIIDVGRGVGGDQVQYNNQRFQVESNTEWFSQDGWKGVLCVVIEPNVREANPTFGFGSSTPGIDNGNENFENGNFE